MNSSMRYLIETVENLLESPRAVMQYLAFNGEDITALEAKKALAVVKHLQKGQHVLYRHMRLTPQVLQNLKAGSSLGIFWSETEKVPRENLLDDPHSGDWAVLKAVVPSKSINLPETAGARLLNQIERNWEDESEVRLHRGAPLQLVSIHLDDGSPAREDLAGLSFVA